MNYISKFRELLEATTYHWDKWEGGFEFWRASWTFIKESPKFLYIAAVHILCIKVYILVPFSDKPVIFYITLRGSFAHSSCLTYEKTVVLVGTISLLLMRFASQLVKIQIPFTLKMEAASSCELLEELHAFYPLHSVTTRQNAFLFPRMTGQVFLRMLHFSFHEYS